MALVNYSDSDDSDLEAIPEPKPSTKPSKVITFQKVVDRSNPGKIRVSLPQPVSQDNKDDDGHPAKRMKTGNGGLSDFKSFLPPPKRTGVISTDGLGGNMTRKIDFVAGVSLKTGAAPGFSREKRSSTELSESCSVDVDVETHGDYNPKGPDLSPAKASFESCQTPAEEVRLVGRPLIFKPLSIARDSAKKKKKQNELSKVSTAVQTTTSVPSTTEQASQQHQKLKVSLFSMSSEPSDPTGSNMTGDYEPIIYGINDKAQDSRFPSTDVDSNDEYAKTFQSAISESSAPMAGTQSLNDIASDLNLSAADRRKLFGRQKCGAVPQATKIINFNTDEEYQHNEELRAAGEQVVHNPVRSIAPGKHSLKKLVNAVASQKEALEESFAKGKSNRAEASSRYGW